MTYDLTGVGNVTNMVGLFQVVNNDIMQGMFFSMFLLGFCVIAFLAFMLVSGDVKKAFIGVGFGAFIFSLLLRIMGLVPDLTLFISLIILVFSLAFTFKGE